MSQKIIFKGRSTPPSGASLCNSCKYSARITGQNCEEEIWCTKEYMWLPDHRVRFKVATCTEWRDIKCPEKYELEDIAWKIEARKRGPKGFENTPEKQEMTVEIKPPSFEE